MHNQPINKLNQSELEGSNTPCLPKPPSIFSILNSKLSPLSSTPLIAILACDMQFPPVGMETIKAVMSWEKNG